MVTAEIATDVVGLLIMAGAVLGLAEWRFRVLQRHFDDNITSIRKCLERLEKRYDDHVDRRGAPIK